jgi:hypothetical protein
MMSVNPTNPSQPVQPGPGRLGDAAPGQPTKPGPGRPGEVAPAPPIRREDKPAATEGQGPKDTVELSEAVRALQERLGIEASALSGLPPERLKLVLERLAQGFYDRPEVRDEVLRRLAGDLGIVPPRE